MTDTHRAEKESYFVFEVVMQDRKMLYNGCVSAKNYREATRNITKKLEEIDFIPSAQILAIKMTKVG